MKKFIHQSWKQGEESCVIVQDWEPQLEWWETSNIVTTLEQDGGLRIEPLVWKITHSGGHFQILHNNMQTKIGSKYIFENKFYKWFTLI